MSRSRVTEDMSTMSWPKLGHMTGGRTREHHLDFKPVDTSEVSDALRAAETVYQLAMQHIPKEVEVSQALLTYPEGEGDAVTITERDMEELQPAKFLGNHIVDFYTRYLERGLSPERGKLFYFFNSFFFTKLLQSTAPTRIDPCKVDYEQLRKWTEEVNLFEKDYVFIPIIERSHWSLVILCNLGSLTRVPNEMTRFPCIVHLDPVQGQHEHESFEGLIRSYVLEAWMDRFEPSIHKDQLRALYQMKYIQAEVPQQDNSHDCGLYVLHYIESFLMEFTSPNFSFASSERGPHFTSPHFVAEVLSKRRYIHNLILELQGTSQERAQEIKEIKHLLQELMQTSQKLQARLEDKGNFKSFIKDMLIASPTILNEGCEINHTSIHEDSMDVQHHQSIGISRGSNEPLSGLQIGPMEYETRCEHLSLLQHDVELEVETTSTTNCNDSIFEIKRASTHEDAIHVQHQQSSALSWLDGLKLQNANSQGVTESFSDNSKAHIKELLIASPSICNEGCEINHISIHKDSIGVQQLQPNGISRGNIEPLIDPQIGPMEYETRREHLSFRQHDTDLEVETTSTTNCNHSIFGIKHASTHTDAIHVQQQQSSKISRLDYEQLDGLELPHVELQGAIESFVDKCQHLELEEVQSCMDLSKPQKRKSKRGKNMTEEETLVLLSCKLKGGHFYKGSGGATHWNLISEEIEKKLGSLPSANQCRLRYDTLLKAYKKYKKYCIETGKTFSEITKEEQLDLKLATTLKEEWYTSMDEIYNKAKISHKRMKLSSNVCNVFHPLSSQDSPTSNLPPISNCKSFEDATVVLNNAFQTIEVALHNVLPASIFNSWNEDLQSTLLNLVQECSLSDWFRVVKNGKFFGLEAVCHRLAILQDREPREILNYIFKLWKLNLVNLVPGMVFDEGQDLAHIDLWKGKTWYLKLEVYEEISKEVLCKNPHLKTYCDSFPIEQSTLHFIGVLSLVGCGELEHLDLHEFPRLRSLTIKHCPNFNLVTGWEVAKGLGSLEISWCNAYYNFPNLRYLFSLKEILFKGHKSNKSALSQQQLFQFSQCANMRRLAICYDKIWLETTDLNALRELKFLEFLSLEGCPFSKIQGLSGLQALTTLNLHYSNLKSVPELGCLKGLTHLDMSNSSVEDVVGVGELHMLISLDLCGCNSLRWLPFLGQLRALVYLNLKETGVKEIPGREDLISLKTLVWDRE